MVAEPHISPTPPRVIERPPASWNRQIVRMQLLAVTAFGVRSWRLWPFGEL